MSISPRKTCNLSYIRNRLTARLVSRRNGRNLLTGRRRMRK